MQDSPANVVQPDWLDEIQWTEDGLVPAIAQDANNGDVLMMAWMNRESLRLTVEEGQAVYWSRSRGKLWRKGESAGHQQVLRDIRLDCDADVVLLKVEQKGGIACHTGRRSCLYRSLKDGQWVSVDPVIKAAGGGDLADDALVAAMKDRLFARAEMITPNGIELAQLGGSDDPAEAARNLLQTGCESVLATGGHGSGIHIINTLYNHAPEPMRWEIDRIGGEYHGTGCTLAAAISAGRASGLSPRAAISQAQNYVHRAILHALEVGKGQPVPDRGILWER